MEITMLVNNVTVIYCSKEGIGHVNSFNKLRFYCTLYDQLFRSSNNRPRKLVKWANIKGTERSFV